MEMGTNGEYISRLVVIGQVLRPAIDSMSYPTPVLFLHSVRLNSGARDPLVVDVSIVSARGIII